MTEPQKKVDGLQTFCEQKMRLNSLNKLIAMDYSLGFNLPPAERNLCKQKSWSVALILKCGCFALNRREKRPERLFSVL